MTTRNFKSTWELAGQLSSSFTQSTKKAQSQLAQMRREYRANEGELRRLQSVMRRSAQGTDSYVNASKRIPALKDDLNEQALAISAVEKESLTGARAQGRLSGGDRAGARRTTRPGPLRAGRCCRHQHRKRRNSRLGQGVKFRGPAGPAIAGAERQGHRRPKVISAPPPRCRF